MAVLASHAPPPIRPQVTSPAKVCRSVLRANQIVQRVNAAVKLYPGVVAAPLVLGTLAGAGGKLLTDAFTHCAGYKPQGALGRHGGGRHARERCVCC